MQASFSRCSAGESAEMFGKLSEDFGGKLKVSIMNEEPQQQNKEGEEEVVVVDVDYNDNDNNDDGDEDDDDDDFTFVCTNPDGSPISADDVFQNGQIRPIFPLFNRDLLLSDDYYYGDSKPKSLRPPLKKLFYEEHDSASSTEPEVGGPAGPFCEWSSSEKTVQDASPECCKKSNSTGFSKLWRFRELVLRSNSDGKDAFVFLNPSHHHNSNEKSEKKNEKVKVAGKKKAKAKGETASLSAYMKSKAKADGDKRKPYLPYKQVGFFTNVNGLSRNVHPF